MRGVTGRMALRYLGVILLAGLLAACELDEPPVHPVELPADHHLGYWLEMHPDLSHVDADSTSFVVVAGQYRDEGGVRFSCPAAGADCKITVMHGCSGFVAVSIGGRASADNHLVELPDDGLSLSFYRCPGNDFSVRAGEHLDMRDVRFSCPADGEDCVVTITSSYCVPVFCEEEASADGTVLGGICVDRIPGVVSVGGAAAAELVPPDVLQPCP